MTIKRTAHANTPRAATWLSYDWPPAAPYADTVHECEYPTHSPIIGPDGAPLQYEPRPPIGFDLTGRK